VKFTREEIMHVSRLAKMGVNEAEVETFARQLSDILENFEILKKVDTEGIPPTTQPIPLDNLLKDDRKKPSIPQDEALANAPNREGEFFRTRAVLE
jgi:aspartyl-tRNA(Asn)/glutamyl-tRNA(Gln) amidotransferase subunit C